MNPSDDPSSNESGKPGSEPSCDAAEERSRAHGVDLSEAQRLIAETLRVPLDRTVRDAFTPRQKALLDELAKMEADNRLESGKRGD